MSVESICTELRKDPRNPDIVRLLKRCWELLVLYDETGIESYLGRTTTMQVPTTFSLSIFFFFLTFPKGWPRSPVHCKQAGARGA